MPESYGLESFKAFAGPIATIFAAFMAAYVSYTFGRAQTELARSQRDIAFDKLKVDLFDRRYRIYTAARNVIEALFNRLDHDQLENTVLQESATLKEAIFFFPEREMREIETILHLVERYMEYLNPEYLGGGDARDDRNAEAVLRELRDIYEHLSLIFSEELGFRLLTAPRA